MKNIDKNVIDGVDTILIEDKILKFIPHEGTKFCQNHIDQLNKLIENNFQSELAYLIDTKNKYESTYESMKGFSSYEKLAGMAFIAYDDEKHGRIKYLNVFPLRDNREVEMKSFENETDAIAWLHEKLKAW